VFRPSHAANRSAWGREIVVVVAPLLPEPLRAHAGHDHGAPPTPSLALPPTPRAEAYGKDVELVLVLDGETLLLYLDDFATNTPIGNAEVRVESMTPEGRREDVAVLDEAAVYRLETPWLAAPGRHDLVVSIQDERRFDLLTATLDVPAPDDEAPMTDPAGPVIPWGDLGVWTLLFGLGLLVGTWLGRRAGRGGGAGVAEPSRLEVQDVR
jgi:hypothetical protein